MQQNAMKIVVVGDGAVGKVKFIIFKDDLYYIYILFKFYI